MSRMQTMNPHKIDALVIAQCSPRHIQSVIEDLVQIIKRQEELAHKVLQLPDWKNIDTGILDNLRELAGDIVWK